MCHLITKPLYVRESFYQSMRNQFIATRFKLCSGITIHKNKFRNDSQNWQLQFNLGHFDHKFVQLYT